MPGELQRLVDKIRHHAYQVTDEDLARLKSTYDDDQLFTLQPHALAPADVRVALDAGVSREAVRDAFYVAFLFNTYDRLADILGWELPADGFYARSGEFLLKKGYSV